MIDVFDLVFEYSGKRVLHGISLHVKKGSVTALVGPNGAGKTTLMRCLSALETPLSGKIMIDGIDISEHPRETHRRMGYLSDFFGLYDKLTVRQCLTYMAWCQNIPSSQVSDRIEAIAEDVEITEFLEEKARTLSRGYRQRLGVGLSLIHEPKILLLDEPASGMDPEARIKLSQLMLRLKEKGLTIIVSSHILAELEDYCSEMLVIRDGKIADHVSLEDHYAEASTMLNIHIPAVTDKQTKLVESQLHVKDVRQNGDVLECLYAGGEKDRVALLKFLIKEKVPVAGFEVKQKTLQKAYMDLADRTAAIEKAVKNAEGEETAS